MTPIPTDAEVQRRSRTLNDIVDDFCCYQESIQAAQDALAVVQDPDELGIIQAGIKDMEAQKERLAVELVKKTDATAGVLRRMSAEIELIAAEEQRLTKRRLAIEHAQDWLKAYVMRVMKEHGTTFMRTPTVTLSIQKNGGRTPVVIDDPGKVPDELCWMKGKIRADLWAAMSFHSATEIDPAMASLEREPSATLIGERLRESGPCAKCKGQGSTEVTGAPIDCPHCHGTGKEPVPGAHLGERAEHLRIT